MIGAQPLLTDVMRDSSSCQVAWIVSQTFLWARQRACHTTGGTQRDKKLCFCSSHFRVSGSAVGAEPWQKVGDSCRLRVG